MLHGPLLLSSQLQMKVPAALARQLGLAAGDRVYVLIDETDPTALKILPAAVVERRYRAGSRAESTEAHPTV